MAGSLGPYRYVHDGELRAIFFLTPQSGQAFSFPIQHTGPFPGSTDPAVTPLLREMLSLLTMSMGKRVAFERNIAATLKSREQIVVRAKLLSLVGHILDKPWAFPALMDTPTCKAAFHELTEIAGQSDKVASTLNDPLSDSGVTFVVKKALGNARTALFGIGLARYFGGKSKDYYAFYARRISDELALRGIPPSSLK